MRDASNKSRPTNPRTHNRTTACTWWIKKRAGATNGQLTALAPHRTALRAGRMPIYDIGRGELRGRRRNGGGLATRRANHRPCHLAAGGHVYSRDILVRQHRCETVAESQCWPAKA